MLEPKQAKLLNYNQGLSPNQRMGSPITFLGSQDPVAIPVPKLVKELGTVPPFSHVSIQLFPQLAIIEKTGLSQNF